MLAFLFNFYTLQILLHQNICFNVINYLSSTKVKNKRKMSSSMSHDEREHGVFALFKRYENTNTGRAWLI